MPVGAQEEFEGHGIRELGGIAKTAVYRVEFSGEFSAGVTQHLKRHGALGENAALAAQGRAAALLELIAKLRTLFFHLFMVFLGVIALSLRDASKTLHQSRPIMGLSHRRIVN